MFNCEVAQEKLRTAFYAVKEELGINDEIIDFYVNAENIHSIQVDRERMLEPLTLLKEELEKKFPNFRIKGRVKSLASTFGKYMMQRSTWDVFGIKIITPNYVSSYAMAAWLMENYKYVEFEDRTEFPKPNGYSDLKVIVRYEDVLVEFIVQTNRQYADSDTLQAHHLVYPWKYRREIRELPLDYKEMKF